MDETRLVRSVERTIPAPAAAIFALLADPRRHPDIDGSGMVKSVKTSDLPLRQGSTFSMHMKRGLAYSTENTIVEFEPDQVIAWQTRPITMPLPLLLGGRTWRYELTPVDGGTLVRETWDIRGERNRRLVSRDAGTAVKGMRRTLERIEQLTTPADRDAS